MPTKTSPAALIAIGLPLIVVGVLTGRSDIIIFGLSSGFWAGFLMTVGLSIQIFGVALAAHGNALRR